MARYSNFLHRKVEVLYRAGDVILPASGMFVADSGRSIFLEQHFEQRGQTRNFRWEIPYQYIVRLHEAVAETASLTGKSAASSEKQRDDAERVSQNDPKKSRAHAASALGGAASFLNPAHRPKTV